MAGDLVRREVRHRVASLLQDLITGTATATNTTTLTDTSELSNYADDTLTGAFVFLYGSATGAGQERRISDNAQSTGVITVPTWTDPADTITYEIHRGWRVADYNTAINQAINDLRGVNGALVEQIQDVAITLTANNDAASYEYNLTSNIEAIYEVWMESATSDIYDFWVPKDVFTLQKRTAATDTAQSLHKLVFDRNRWQPVSGRQLRIIYAGFQQELTDDETTLLSEHLLPFVTHQAAHYLLDPSTGLGTPQANANEKRAVRHAQLAEQARTRLPHRVKGGAIRVPV